MKGSTTIKKNYTYSDLINKIPNKYSLSMNITKKIEKIVEDSLKNKTNKEISTTKLFEDVANSMVKEK